MIMTPFLFKMMRFWPPYLGAGISVTHCSNDFTKLSVKMKKRFWNKNYVGTHFGGSLYSMTDPFYMLLLMQQIGRGYIVWDKAASIKFVKPGRSTVYAHFDLPKEKVEEIKNLANQQTKVEPVLFVNVVDENNEVIAVVEKVLYVKKK